MTDLAQLERDLLAAVKEAANERALDDVRVSALGKKGTIAELLKTLGSMSPDERKSKGAAFNALRDRVAEALAARKTQLEQGSLDARLSSERVDVSLAPTEPPRGTVHPVSQVKDEVTAIFADLGFSVAEGPDIESDDYNFTKLNIPPEHPARQMHDTFYLKPQADGSRPLLRTHTSPVQVRTMLAQKPPIRIIAPGRTYRHDSDATHSPMFHQVEALVIDEETHLGHLKWLIEEFCKAFFEVSQVAIRLRPSYFPFTEPSMEVDVQCDRSGGALNMPPEHPARQEHDTFYFHPRPGSNERMVLRTHTSPVQIRTMETQAPPIRIIAPGRTFRSDSDQTHTPMFHQVEGLVVDEHTHLGHLKGTLEAFAKAFFEVDAVKMRFRPSHFPFTEPSMEVDIGCSWEGGELKIGAGDSWLEILGSGMVHANVIRAGGLDPEKYQGFAFGMGIDRIAMLKYGIPDLRAFFEADLRWLCHYGFSPLASPSLAEGLSL